MGDKQTKEVKKRVLTAKKSTIADMVIELKTEATPYAEHRLKKDW